MKHISGGSNTGTLIEKQLQCTSCVTNRILGGVNRIMEKGRSRRTEEPVIHVNANKDEGPGAAKHYAGFVLGREHVLEGESIIAE